MSPDIVDAATRSRMMAGIRGKDTKPEMIVRRGLHALGFRYRLHDRNLTGVPDLVFPRLKAVIFVHGCFWHRHSCGLFRLPGSRKDFWENKLTRNQARDAEVQTILMSEGWRVLNIWECALRGRDRLSVDDVISHAAKWLRSGISADEIRGRADASR